jgi:signal transduction histidine kinase
LLVEDNPDDALLIQEMLADADGGSFEWIHAERLSEGLEELAAGSADVVLLDLSLPDSHGLDTFATAHSHAPETPIILLTGLDDEELAVQAVQLGAQDYLSKSRMEGQLLVRSLRYAIERQNLLAELVIQSGELARLNEDLRRSNAELEQFASVASHDLQQPLRAISGHIRLLSRRYKGRMDSDADEFLGFVTDGADRMQLLIDALLQYAQVGASGAPLAPTDCEEALARAASNVQPVVTETHSSITHDSLPHVRGDSTQLVQLFQNLLSNAIKFRGNRTPRIHVSSTRRGDRYVIAVADNGIGIPADHSEAVFGMFKRLHGRAKYPGTGLGLAICSKIVDRHGGRIWVESKPDQGSTFYFELRAVDQEQHHEEVMT